MSVHEIELATPTSTELAHEDSFKDDALAKDAPKNTVPIMSTDHISTPVASPVPAPEEPAVVEAVTEPAAEVAADAAAVDVPVATTDGEKQDTEMTTEPVQVNGDATDAPVPTSTEVKTEQEPAPVVTEQKVARPASPTLEENPAKRVKTEEEPVLETSNLAADDPRNPPAGVSQPLPKHQAKFALASLRAVKRLRDAGPFLAPVDIVKLNIPTYFDFVKTPMDLGTMEKKVTSDEYTSVSEFIADMDLIVSNCTVFNGPTSEISAMGRNIRQSFEKHMKNMPPYEQSQPVSAKPKRKSMPATVSTPKSQRIAAATAAAAPKSVPAKSKTRTTPPPTARRESAVDGRPKREIHPARSKDLPYDTKPRRRKTDAELKFCGTVLKELTNKKHEAYSFPFLEPVDPVALNCPAYLTIIKEPMDLSTIGKKYNANEYETADEFEADVRLMFKNCYTFNPSDSPVNLMGHRLEGVFDKKWADKPVPPATPAFSSDDESDYDSDDHMELITNPAITFLEEQLERMTKELTKLKKEALRESREQKLKARQKKRAATSKKPGSDGRRKSGPGRKVSSQTSLTAPEHISFDMKKELSEAIPELDESKLDTVIALIRETMPNLDTEGQQEIELDIDTMPPETVRKLYNFVILHEPNGNTPTTSAAANAGTVVSPPAAADMRPTKSKKSKPLSEEEQSRQIQEIQKKIQQFDRAESGGPGGVMVSSDEDEDDNDNDGSSDSSSEEE